ncbi:MAG: hypothetical protein U0359_08995 [Byssovorax sp.]
MGLLLAALGPFAACESAPSEPVVPADAGDAGDASDAMEAGPLTATAGEDIDTRTPRDLEPSYTLPPEFGAALSELSLTSKDLSFPDLGLTFDKERTRLHWTDLVRHQGDLAPGFGSMVATDVETAMELADPAAQARDLLVAQGTYGLRDGFVASRFDKAITVLAEGQPLLDALEAFYVHAPVPGGPAVATPWESVEPAVAEQVSRFSLPAQIALAQAIRGLLVAAEMRDSAFTKNGVRTMEQWAVDAPAYWKKRLTVAGYPLGRDLADGVDFEELARAGQIAVRAVESARVALAGEPTTPGAKLDLTGPLGRIALSMEATDDMWTGKDFFLLVDAGGNDTYTGDIASNVDLYHPVTVVLDLAGNDQYKPSFAFDIKAGKLPSEKKLGSKQAAGMFGIAVLDDGAGDDTYLCTTSCQGYGLFGVGVHIDRGGSDVYKGYALSQGAAEYGYGLLLDTGGSKDTYETYQTSQGYGGTRGIGWLVDDGGDDDYLAIEDPIISNWAGEGTNWSGSQGFGFGLRIFPQGTTPGVYLSGGLGGLFDLAGNDHYKCAVMCQGFGYFFGAGMLYDKAGDDEYVVSHKYGMGGATHQSIGLFLDDGGADKHTYLGHGSTGGGEGVGLGYDLGVAFHIDRGKENDTYDFPVEIGWIMGFSRHPSLGVLINEGGDDTYHAIGIAGEKAFGTAEAFSTDRSAAAGTLKTPTLGMFLDLGGKNDVYDLSHAGIGNGAKWTQTTPLGDGWDPALDHGYGLDKE